MIQLKKTVYCVIILATTSNVRTKLKEVCVSLGGTPLKFLHLSDLHIGKTVNGFSMILEQKCAFEQIIKYIRSEKPTAIIIAGDVYDRAIPGVEAVRVFDDFLTELANESVAVLLISGNHDSPERINYASRLLSDRRIFFYGAFDGTIHKVTLSDEYGDVNFWLLPFIKPTMVRGVFAKSKIENHENHVDQNNHSGYGDQGDHRSYGDQNNNGGYGDQGNQSGYIDQHNQSGYVDQNNNSGDNNRDDHINYDDYYNVIKAALESTNIDKTARNVLVSHQFYTKTGVTPIRSESELNPVGGLDAIDTDIIECFDYVALGHLHGGQSVGSECVRYCGSPIKYSFSEWRHEKSITLVEMGIKGELTVKRLPLVPLHDMRVIKGEIDILMSDNVSSLADKDDYLRVILTDEAEIIDPIGKLRSVYPNIMSLDFENSRTSIEVAAITSDSETIERLSDFELFSEFFLETQGTIMSEEQAEIIRNLLEKSEEE